METEVFGLLNKIDCSEHIEKKSNGKVELSYLSWAWAWHYVKSRYSDATYTIFKDEQNRPYIEDADYGIMCYTTVTIQGQALEMWLPVMDGANRALRRKPYVEKVWNKKDGKWEEKTVAAATMFDINKTIMRCLVKNLAMFGLGLYIYAGEDLLEDMSEEKQQSKSAEPSPESDKQKPAETPYIDQAKAMEKSPQARMLDEIHACQTAIELQEIQARLDKNTTMSDAVRRSWQDKICEQGNKIHATKTQDGWMDDADLVSY